MSSRTTPRRKASGAPDEPTEPDKPTEPMQDQPVESPNSKVPFLEDNRREEASAVPTLSPVERREVQDRVGISATVVHETVREEGERELERRPLALAFSGLAAGLSMGFSFIGEGLLLVHLPDASWRPLVASLGYSLGFVIVIGGRQQLFTETTITAALPMLSHPNLSTLTKVLRMWSIVLLMNLLGTFIFATIIAHTPIFPPEMQPALLTLERASVRGGFGLTMLRGVFAGWLIALVVWLAPAAQYVRLHIIIILTYFIALGGFAHAIAGAAEVFYGVSLGMTSWPDALFAFLLPTVIGNILGGVTLVGALNYAQVAAQTSHDERYAAANRTH